MSEAAKSGTIFNAKTETLVTDGSAHVSLANSEDTSNGVINVENGPYEYEECPANATTTLGATGAAGDFLHTLSVRFNDAAGNASFSLKDNGVTVFSVSAADNTNGPAMATLTYTFDCVSKDGAWSVTCASGVAAFATGRFTA